MISTDLRAALAELHANVLAAENAARSASNLVVLKRGNRTEADRERLDELVLLADVAALEAKKSVEATWKLLEFHLPANPTVIA